MDFSKLMQIQSELNDFTLSEKNVSLIQHDEGWEPKAIPASMSLGAREGEYIRHQSAVIQMCDMYQWAGDREMLELIECFMPLTPIDNPRANARIEVVDIMHFDLSVLALTKTKPEEIASFLQENEDKDIKLQSMVLARKEFSNLQLRKWWTSNKVDIVDIRERAINEFGLLLLFAVKQPAFDEEKPLFDSFEDIEQTYLKKVNVNYERIKQNYDHVANKEAGNDSI